VGPSPIVDETQFLVNQSVDAYYRQIKLSPVI